MTEFARFELEDGGWLTVEVDAPPGTAPAGRGGDVPAGAVKTFEQALSGVRTAAGSTLRQFREMAQPPDEVEITFGVKLDAQAGAVIAKTGVQGNFEVKLKWQRDSASS